jgi:hypothetical protein
MTAPVVNPVTESGSYTNTYDLKVNGVIQTAASTGYLFQVYASGNLQTGWVDYAQYLSWMSTNEASAENTALQVFVTAVGNISNNTIINSALVGNSGFILDASGPAESVNGINFSGAYNAVGNIDFTNVKQQSISGSLTGPLIQGDSVWVSLNNGASWRQADASAGQSTWMLNNVNLQEGGHAILAQVEDGAGNILQTYTQDYTLATHAPTASISQSVSGLVNTPYDTISVNAAAEAVGGNSIASVAIYDSGAYVGNASYNGNGNWSFTDSYLSEGSINNFYAVVTDQAGNTKTTAELKTVSVAEQAPSVSITGNENGLNNSTKETLTVTALADQAASTGNAIKTVAIYDNNTFLGDAKADGNGVWTYTVNNVSNGIHDYTAMVTDKAGNFTNPADYYGSVSDFAAVKAPVAAISQTDSGLVNSNQDTITVDATADNVTGNAIQTVTIYDKDNAGFSASAVLQSNGEWTYTASGLSNGAHQFYAVVSDVAGNQTTTKALAADNVSASGIGGSITGSLPAISNSTTEYLSGTATAALIKGDSIASVSIFDTVNGVQTYLGNAQYSGGNWGFSNISPLPDGQQAFSAVITDSKNNTVTENLAPVSIATQAPSVVGFKSVSSLTTPTYITFTILPTAENVPGDSIVSVALYDNGMFIGDATNNGYGNWNFYHYYYLTVGQHNFTAEVIDAVGNSTDYTGLGSVDVVPANASPNPIYSVNSGIDYPIGISFDGKGDVYVGYVYDNTVQEFDASGNLLHTYYGLNGQPAAADNNGDFYIANYNLNNVVEYSAAGVLLKTLTTDVSSPDIITTDSKGDVFVGNYGNFINPSVEEFSPTGALLLTITDGVSNPYSIQIDKSGDIFVGNRGNNTVTEYDASGNLLHTFSEGISLAESFAIDNAGNVYVANTGANNVEEFDASGNLISIISTGREQQDPISVAIGRDDSLYVAYFSGDVQEYNAAGQLIGYLNNGFYIPSVSLATDSSGNVYVGYEHSFEKFPSYNALTAEASGSISNPTVVYNPNPGDNITIPDATSFDNTAVTSNQVEVSGGSTTSLADWVNAALSSQGADIAQNEIAWFQFQGSTYLVEQANAQGTGFGPGDTLVQLVGTLNESAAMLNQHTLTL